MPQHSGPTRPIPLRPLRRPDGSVQFGVGPRSVRFAGLTTAELRWLSGTETDSTLARARSRAALEGIAPARAGAILERLVVTGLLTPVARTEVPTIAVVGHGALPALLVDVVRQDSRTEAVRVRPGGERESPAGLAVVVGPGPADAEAVQPWLSAGTPVLPLWCQPDQASVGPLLSPGGRPCLQCLELTRTGVDPGWPWLRAQLTRVGVAAPEPVDGHPAVRLLTAGLATALALDHVDGRPGTPEWSVEVALPGPTLERHRWSAHPECPGCGAPTDARPPTRGAPRHDPDRPDTMAV